tara:strand:- start:2277 stop:2579 length:303 start_codon:yes stop_codon:yes gene_type:complete
MTQKYMVEWYESEDCCGAHEDDRRSLAGYIRKAEHEDRYECGLHSGPRHVGPFDSQPEAEQMAEAIDGSRSRSVGVKVNPVLVADDYKGFVLIASTLVEA